MAAYTTDDLVTSVKRRILMPSSQQTFLPADILAVANEELLTEIVGIILGNREEYLVSAIPYDQATGVGFTYRFPPRALFERLRDVLVLDSGGTMRALARIGPEEATYFNAAGGNPIGFYLKGNQLVMVPALSGSIGTLRMSYYLRPNTLVPVASCGKIGFINYASAAITFTGSPPNFNVNQSYDLISNTPGFDLISMDLQVISAGSTAITFFVSSLPQTLQIGDWVCLSGTSPIPQIPLEMHPILYQRTAMKVLEAMGDADGFARAAGVYEAMKTEVLKHLSPRVTGKAKKIINSNSLASNIMGGRRYWP